MGLSSARWSLDQGQLFGQPIFEGFVLASFQL